MQQPIFQNDLDTENQKSAAEALQAYMNRIPIIGGDIRVVETETERYEPNDLRFEDKASDWLVGVGEIKTREVKKTVFVDGVRSRRDGIIYKGWVFEKERLNKLKAMYKPITLVCDYLDGVAFVTYRTIDSNRDIIKDAPSWMMKDNHGDLDAPHKHGILIPWRLMTEIEKHGTG